MLKPARFLIADIAVPRADDAAFRYSLALSRVRIASVARVQVGSIYTLAATGALSLWKFIDGHLGPRTTERDADAFIAAHVRRVEPYHEVATDQGHPFVIRWHHTRGSKFGAPNGLAMRDRQVLTFATREEAAREAAWLGWLVPGAQLIVEP